MTSSEPPTGSLIWASRGRSWGFRFLLDAGLDNPLSTYDLAFAGSPEARSVLTHGEAWVALRFSDPDGRVDASGRVIPHEFIVVGGPLAGAINSLESGIGLLWDLVGGTHAKLWASPRGPSVSEVEALLEVAHHHEAGHRGPSPGGTHETHR